MHRRDEEFDRERGREKIERERQESSVENEKCRGSEEKTQGQTFVINQKNNDTKENCRGS